MVLSYAFDLGEQGSALVPPWTPQITPQRDKRVPQAFWPRWRAMGSSRYSDLASLRSGLLQLRPVRTFPRDNANVWRKSSSPTSTASVLGWHPINLVRLSFSAGKDLLMPSCRRDVTSRSSETVLKSIINLGRPRAVCSVCSASARSLSSASSVSLCRAPHPAFNADENDEGTEIICGVMRTLTRRQLTTTGYLALSLGRE